MENRSHSRTRSVRRFAAWGLPLIAYAAVSLAYRRRPQPLGVNNRLQRYRVDSERLRFFHDTTWQENSGAQHVLEITDEAIRIIKNSRRFTLVDVFLFNLHHTTDKGPFIPRTRQIADAFGSVSHPRYFITDPLNTSYGTQYNAPLKWLEDAGVTICITNLHKLRDNNMIYSPLWRLVFQWFGTGTDGRLTNPLQKNRTTTVRAYLEAANARGNHRNLIIADDAGDGYVTMVTSSNLEDASCYFCNTALTIHDDAVAYHYLEAERAVARMSGCPVPEPISTTAKRAGRGDAEVTPLMGNQIATSLVADVEQAQPGDRLWVCTQFLSHRRLIEALLAASRRGVQTTIILDQNKINFGERKRGFPNQYVAQELVKQGHLALRWANTLEEENHNKLLLLERDNECIVTLGSANFTRRSLSNTVLEADVRVAAPASTKISRDVATYVRWMAEAPRSLPAETQLQNTLLSYWLYRLQEATGGGTF